VSAADSFQRHDLAWLDPGWREALLLPIAPGDETTIEDWVERGRPAVICRRGQGTPAGSLSLGIALPGPGRRLGLLVTTDAIARHTGPLRLRDVVASAPDAWQGPLAALDVALTAVGTPAGVFGSLAWQHLSGEPYLRATSDVDLLLSLLGPASLQSALDVLAAHDQATVRLDGEVLFPGGHAVAWRELAGRPARVLVKSVDGVALLPIAAALGIHAEGMR
jgi:phosphoribosyl-dephospho-CoA transferase